MYNKITKQSLFTSEKEKLRKKPTDFKFIDLFAGIGGTRIAFERVGGECVFSSEWDSSCQKTYEANFGEIPHGDIAKIDEKKIPDFDILVAGFPCQPFSSIGKRQGFKHKTQGTLFYDIARIIGAKKPSAFLLENVKGLTTHNDGDTLRTIISVLEDDLGYKTFYEILDASNFGVPQKRQRIYIVGFKKELLSKDDKYIHPTGTNNKVFINQFLEKNADGYSISKHLQENYLFKLDDGRPKLVNEKSDIHVKTLVASYHKIQRLTGTFVEDGPTGIRLFTQNECKAIMGFPEDFVVPVSRTQMYRQFGNSVAVPAVQAVAESIKQFLIKNNVLKGKNEAKKNKPRAGN
ncbi:MAG: DNA (cytosine-5-)-methyltransferase [Patescibacteria group bacterium]|jgi:DNA (cytosine-5)-methyltransferase 1